MRPIIREHRIGDIGWAIEQHGKIYHKEFGWNEEFEALVATLFAQFATQHDPAKERCWIAENNSERIGCVFVVIRKGEPDTAQLRCLLVDPRSRGLGVGRALVEKCIYFSRQVGYKRLILWTNDVLTSARHIYETTGFVIIDEEPQHRFGKDVVSQTWSLDL